MVLSTRMVESRAPAVKGAPRPEWRRPNKGSGAVSGMFTARWAVSMCASIALERREASVIVTTEYGVAHAANVRH